ncbi:MAG: OmpA family protein [Phycisphaerae bacterium]
MITRIWRRPSYLIGSLALVSALWGFTGCVSMDEYKRLDAAWQEAKRSLADCENDKKRLLQQIDQLKAQLAAQSGLGNGLDALKAENALLQQKLAELQKKYDELVAFAGTIKLPTPVSDALQKLADKYPDLLEWDPKLGRLRFKSDLTFDLGSTEVKPRAKEALATLAGILNLPEIVDNQIRIIGHTDDVPIRVGSTMSMNPNNWFLSTNRAHAIREVLFVDGVADTRLQPAGEGNTQPVAENAPNHKGNEKNRRVEIFILPSKVPANAVAAPESDSKVIVSGARSAAAPKAPRKTSKPAPSRTPTPPVAPAPEAPLVPVPTTLPVGNG